MVWWRCTLKSRLLFFCFLGLNKVNSKAYWERCTQKKNMSTKTGSGSDKGFCVYMQRELQLKRWCHAIFFSVQFDSITRDAGLLFFFHLHRISQKTFPEQSTYSLLMSLVNRETLKSFCFTSSRLFFFLIDCEKSFFFLWSESRECYEIIANNIQDDDFIASLVSRELYCAILYDGEIIVLGENDLRKDYCV